MVAKRLPPGASESGRWVRDIQSGRAAVVERMSTQVLYLGFQDLTYAELELPS